MCLNSHWMKMKMRHDAHTSWINTSVLGLRCKVSVVEGIQG